MSQTTVPSGSPMAGKVMRGRKGKSKKEKAAPVEPVQARRYGHDSELEQDEMDDMPVVRGVNFPSMNEAQLRQFAMQNFGRRFQESESREYMLRDIQSRMNVSHGARYA